VNGMKFAFITDDPEGLEDRALLAGSDEKDLTLRRLLAEHSTVLSEKPLTPAQLDVHVKDVTITASLPRPNVPGYPIPGLPLGRAGDGVEHPDAGDAPPAESPAGDRPAEQAVSARVVSGDLARHPDSIRDREAVVLAHEEEISRAASYLEGRLSVLIRCEKILVSHLSEEIAVRAGGVAKFVRLDPKAADERSRGGGLLGGVPSSRRSDLMEALLSAVAAARPGELLVIPNLDLLAGGSDSTLNSEARELAEALYEKADSVLLAFCDPSLTLPEVLAARFAVRLAIDILPRQVVGRDGGRAPVGRALVTRAEADLFAGYDEVGLYKHVAGLNAIRLRHGLQFAANQYMPPANGPALTPETRPTFRQLIAELQTFKVKTSSSFEVPNVTWEAIGGYHEVKKELEAAIEIIDGAGKLPEHLRTELVPAGFIFHGPPGTGKTLFAKAVASRLAATIMVVSGPEITDKYVGESERKIRELFADARRNAPSVVVFDEFDSIAAQRTARDDGGSRAGNAIVAQLLTELDGFRPDVPVLIIGTTNRLDLIDEALLRPSRFRPIHIGTPELDARREIAGYHAGHFGVGVSPELLDRIAAATDQFSGDDIRSLFRDARAGELTGEKVPASPYRLGELVGRLRRARQIRELQRSGVTAAPTVTAEGRRQRLRDQSSGAVRRRQFDRRAIEAASGSRAGQGREPL
jgi:transitional endoplasmic reticulum ATPase